jgi:Tol biopolymer transport system component
LYPVAGWAEDEIQAYVKVSTWDADDMVQIVSLPSGEVTGALIGRLPSFSYLSPHGRFVVAESGYDQDAAVSVISVENPMNRLALEGMKAPNEPWSPDGRYLWLVAPEGLAVVDAERMEVVSEISSDTAGVATEEWGLFANPEHWIDGGVWSPDGSRFALSVSAIPPQESGSDPAANILIANVDGSFAETVGDFRDPKSLTVADWAADGRLLVIEDNESLAFVDPETGEREVVFKVR